VHKAQHRGVNARALRLHEVEREGVHAVALMAFAQVHDADCRIVSVRDGLNGDAFF